MAVTFYAESVAFPNIKKRKTSEWIKSVAKNYGKKVGEVSYLFCTDEKMLEVNREFLSHDFFTDIITFDYSEGNMISGDIFISLETVFGNSQKFQTSFDEELHRVIIHGILHLCGIDDKTEAEEKKMRDEENKALKLVTDQK